jgi:hypothetical protein
VSLNLLKSEGSKPRPWWAKQSLYRKVGKNPTPSVGLSLIANCELRIANCFYRFATRTNKNIPIPKKTKLGNQAPIKGERTPACAIAPLIKKIK